MTKKCIKCLNDKDINKFYKIKANKDGYCNTCIDCYSKITKERYYKNIEKERIRSRIKAKKYKHTISKEAIIRGKKKWSLLNKKKTITHLKTNRLVHSGIIKKEPCFLCGGINSQAHHNNYNDPIHVWWLCPKCHSYIHRMLRVIKKECNNG